MYYSDSLYIVCFFIIYVSRKRTNNTAASGKWKLRNVGCFSCRNRDAVQGTREQLLWFCTEKTV